MAEASPTEQRGTDTQAVRHQASLVALTGGESLDQHPTASVPIAALRPADSPRIDGENQDHVRVLAELDRQVPPIVVHRPTMRVVDGMHRLRAAELRGQDTIEVRFIDGAKDDLFVWAVHTNIAHGLPLSLSDRKAAVERILATHPNWSNRRIAAVAGLTDKTVGALRRRVAAENPHLHGRLGLDGRVHPVDTTEGRKRAGQLLTEQPTASLREISAQSGVSTGTVRDVRDRLRRGMDPAPLPRPTRKDGRQATRPVKRGRGTDPVQLLRNLKIDPVLRLSESGRLLLRVLETSLIDSDMRRRMLTATPDHCRPNVASLAAHCAAMWQELARSFSQPAPCRIEDNQSTT